MQKKHCDAFDLQDAWTNGKIKGTIETFLAALFNFNRISIDVDDSNKKEIYLDDMILDSDDDSDDTDDEATETPSCRITTKSIRAYSIYQKMVYTLTDAKIKTLFIACNDRSICLFQMSQSQHQYNIEQNRCFH